MVETLAKKYVKALVENKDATTVEKYCNEINTISTAFCDEKFVTIIASSDVTTSAKVNLIISFVDGMDNAVKNLIKILADNRRLEIIPSLANEMATYLSSITKNYNGVVYSNEALESSYIKNLESQFSQKFGVSLSLSNKVCDYDGIKVEIDGLGIEIGLSKERLKSQMIEHILKAV
jgi:F-type H+-transporting ATPase subunit delta